MRPSERPTRPRSRRRAALALAVAAAAAGACVGLPRPSPGTARTPAAEVPTDEHDPEKLADELLAEHNRIRAEHDLPPLRLSQALGKAASEQVDAMRTTGKIRHIGPDGSQPADRVARQGYDALRVGENVAGGQETVAQVMDGWMNSPGHRRNILGDYVHLGASRGEDDDGRAYWCVVFATPIPRLDPSRAAAEVVRRINERRAEDDLPPLEADEALTAAAADHARAMAEAGSLQPEGPSYLDAINEAGIGYRRVAASVAAGAPTPEDLLDSLDADEARRRDLLGDFDRVGVGYATGEGRRPYWSLLFLESPSP